MGRGVVIPSQVMINGVVWTIEFKRRVKIDKTTDCYGLTDLKLKKILLVKGMSQSLLRRIYLHEIFHAVLFSYGIQIPGGKEEDIADFLSVTLDELFHIEPKHETKDTWVK